MRRRSPGEFLECYEDTHCGKLDAQEGDKTIMDDIGHSRMMRALARGMAMEVTDKRPIDVQRGELKTSNSCRSRHMRKLSAMARM